MITDEELALIQFWCYHFNHFKLLCIIDFNKIFLDPLYKNNYKKNISNFTDAEHFESSIVVQPTLN